MLLATWRAGGLNFIQGGVDLLLIGAVAVVVAVLLLVKVYALLSGACSVLFKNDMLR